MARVLIVLADGFNAAELRLKKMLERSGHDVRIAAKQRITIKSKEGESVMPDLALYEVNPDYFDFAVVCGEDVKNTITPELVGLIRKCVMKKGVAGVNNGAVALAFAGVLNGKNATVAQNEKSIKFLRDSGARYKADPIVVDDNVLTAVHPEMVDEIVEEINKMLKR